MSVTKECRPKSALRRKAVKADRDLDLTEGETNQEALEEYTEMIQLQPEPAGIFILTVPILIKLPNFNLASLMGTPRLSMSSTSHRQYPVEQALKEAGVTRAQR